MTIGPDPMTRTLRMSSRLGINSPHEVLRSCRPRGAWDPAAILRGDPDFRRTSLCGSFHEVDEAVEQVGGVVRARRGLGVVLDREGGHLEALQPFDDVVVEAHVAHPHPTERRLRLDL